MERYRILRLETARSTNTYARETLTATDDLTPVVVVTDNQTAGRGQRGNSWESEPGKNLTFSLVVFPRWLSASHQFELSMLVSVGIVNALRKCVDKPEWLKVKWPNDIYFGDKKLAGILIENSVSDGRIERSVIGIGLNVNQKEFRSDAPNPISLCQVAGVEMSRSAVLEAVVNSILDMIDGYADEPEVDELVYMYNTLLWRRDDGFHKWEDTGSHRFFEAKLVEVEADGRLVLEETSGQRRKFLFKEVQAVL